LHWHKGDHLSHTSAGRYLLVIDSLDCGGAERHAVDLAGALAARGHSVTLACSVAGHFASNAKRAGVRVVELCDEVVKRRFSARFARRVRDLVRAEGFDIVHGHLYAGGLAAAVATVGTGTPLLLTEQTEAPWRSRRQRLVSRLAYRRATQVIGVSSAITHALEHEFGVPTEKLRCIPNGVAMPENADRRDRFERPPVIGLVARLQPEKDVPTFLRCAAHLAARFPDATFQIAGDGPLRGELQDLARELGLGTRLRFLGTVDDMDAFFEEVDLLACSSVAEGTPLAIAEAMCARVPVVATAVGGIPDQIEDGRDGLLVEPGDADVLAARIEWLLERRVDGERMADAAYRRAAHEFSLEAMASKTEAVYHEALAPRRAAAGRRTIEVAPSEQA
jgi:glycosyltransferase involved in cell wall biosynthesis